MPNGAEGGSRAGGIGRTLKRLYAGACLVKFECLTARTTGRAQQARVARSA